MMAKHIFDFRSSEMEDLHPAVVSDGRRRYNLTTPSFKEKALFIVAVIFKNLLLFCTK